MATCINDDGTVAGMFWETGSYAQKGFVYFADGTISTFVGPDAGGSAITAVTAISASGSVIATYAAPAYTNRGYLLAQPGGGAPATIQDLGDLGAATYVWPVALNAYDQVAGTIYFGFRSPPPRVFFWDGTMSLVDVSASLPASDWWAVGLNANGSLIGLYSSPAGSSGTVHSFLWQGSSATDLGDLGGGFGAAVSVIDEDDTALGTSLNAAGRLDLFRYNPSHPLNTPALTDLGSVGVYAGDQTFQPVSLSILEVQRHASSPVGPGGGAQTLFDLVGFGTDALGNTRSLLWKDGAIHGVIDLLPAYLSFTTISSDYGSKVLINSAEQIACAGTNAQGKQMALLLSLDPDTDDDGLPDSWEMRYFGHLGVDLSVFEPGGGGLSNWQAYQQGLDPNNFYNGHQPHVAIISGDDQTGSANRIVQLPLVVRVTDGMGNNCVNAKITFTVVSGGGLVQESSSGTPASFDSVFTDLNGQAQTYFKLPDSPGATSTITAITTNANATAVVFHEKVGDGGETSVSPFAPKNVVSQGNFDGSLDLTWENNSDDITRVEIELRRSDGTWRPIITLPPGTTSYHFDPTR